MPGPDTATAEDALQSHLPMIQAIDAKTLRIANLRATDAVSAAQKMVERVDSDRQALEHAFTNPPFQEIDELVPRALALWAAEKRSETFPAEASDLAARYAEAGELKTVAIKVLDLIAGDESAVRIVLNTVRPGTGYADRADDLTAIHPHLVARKDAITKMGVMTEAQIDRVGELAPMLLVKQDNERAAATAAHLRNQAFTHFYAAWSEIERHVDFLHFHHSEARAEYPRLYPHRSKKSPDKF